MERNIKRILLFSVILFALSILFFSVNAVTLQETTNTNDAYDTIEKGTIIIGTTKFSPNTVITAKKAAIAGANDMKVFIAKGGNISKYTEPAIYYYVTTNSWYSVREDGNVEPTENISSIELYYVDNEPKTGIDSVTKEEIKIEEPKENATYTVTFMNDSEVFATQEVKEGEKTTAPSSNPTKAGHTFVGWYKDGASFDFNTKITKNTVLTAEFNAISYTITVGATENGTVTVPKTSAIYNEDITITVAPAEGYKLNSLTVKDAKNNNVTVNATNTFKMTESNVTINATFIRDSAIIDNRNDLAILTEVNKAMTKISNGEDDNLLEITYDKSSNTLKMVVNDEKDETLNVVNYMKSQLDIIDEVTENIKSITYSGTTIDLSNLTSTETRAKIARLLLDLAEESIPSTETAQIAAAKNLTFDKIKVKNITITADYAADKQINYKLVLDIKSTEVFKDTNNDNKITSIANDFTDSEHNALDITYSESTNKVTLSMAAANNSIKVVDYYDSLWDVVKTIANGANTISYKVGSTNGSDSSSTGALKKIVKALLAETGNPTTEEAAEQLSFGEIISNSLNVKIDVDYGNGVILTYTIDFVNT